MIASRDICKTILELPSSAKRILCYAAMPDEVDLWTAIDSLALDGKEILLPRCRGKHIECVRFETREQLSQSPFGILEPQSGEAVEPHALDLALTPGRAFDVRGNRLGRGASFYDRFFSRFSGVKCGVAFDCQVFEKIPAEPHDIPVDMIVTEKRMIYCR